MEDEKDVRYAKIGTLNLVTAALELYFQTLRAAGKVVPVLTIGQVFNLRYALAQKEEEFIKGASPSFEDIQANLEEMLSKAAAGTVPPKAPEAPGAPVAAADPSPADVKGAPPAAAPSGPAAKPEKGIKVADTIKLIKKDGTAFLLNDGKWYVIRPESKVNAKIEKGAKVTVYFNQGAKDRFVNSVYPSRS